MNRYLITKTTEMSIGHLYEQSQQLQERSKQLQKRSELYREKFHESIEKSKPHSEVY